VGQPIMHKLTSWLQCPETLTVITLCRLNCTNTQHTWESRILNSGRKIPRKETKWEDNIKMNHGGTGCKVGKWMELAQDHDQWQLYYHC